MFGIGCSVCRRTSLRFLSTPGSMPSVTAQCKNLILRNPSSLLFKFMSSTTQNQGKDDSFTLSYLINSCELSPDSALAVSKCVQLKSPAKPDAVFNLLKTHGFSQSQISDLIRKRPPLLLANSEKNLLPKLKYLYSKGASPADVVGIFVSYPWLFWRSLEKQLIPSFDLLRDLLQSDEKVIATIKSNPKILDISVEGIFKPNLKILRDNKVSVSSIAYLVQHQTSVMLTRPSRMNEMVERAKKYGFDPSQSRFVIAIKAFRSLSSESSWERKVSLFGRLGWSEETTLDNFQRYPCCMLQSEDKVIAAMDYYFNKLGIEPSYISRRPHLLGYSLEKRVIPRCTAIQILESKGLIKKCDSLSFIMLTQRLFVQRFVTPYLREAPELLELIPESWYTLWTLTYGLYRSEQCYFLPLYCSFFSFC